MNQTWYETTSYGIGIRPVTVIKETDSRVFVKGVTRNYWKNKKSSYESFYPDFELARADLIRRCESRKMIAQEEVEKQQEYLNRLNSMKESQ